MDYRSEQPYPWRIHYTRSFSENTGIFTGPALNMLLADENLPAPFVPCTIADHSSEATGCAGWRVDSWHRALLIFDEHENFPCNN